MKKFTIYILLILLCSTTAGIAANNAEHSDANDDKIEQTPANEAVLPLTKAQADSAFIKQNYTEAIAIYEKLLKQGVASEIYYNLGNAYFRTDNIAKAILNYERALLYAPNNGDYRANLAIARAKIVDKYEPTSELFFITWGKWITNLMTSNQWAVCTMLLFIIALMGIGLLLLSKIGKIKRIGLITACITLVLTLVSGYCAYIQKSVYINRDAAIVIEPSIEVKSTPSESGTTLFVLHEGKRVTIKDDSMSSWKEIELENGKVGWLPIGALEKI